MKSIYLLACILLINNSIVQKEDTVYIYFDINSTEKCKVDEEGKGYQNLNKFRKEYKGKDVYFRICEEAFLIRKTINSTYSEKALDKFNIVGLKHLISKKEKSILKFNPFEKIFILEKVSIKKYVLHEVIWIDDWVMIDD